jgi:hypothetical protein
MSVHLPRSPSFRPLLVLALPVALAALATGCTLGAPTITGDSCADAEAHLRACLGEAPDGDFLPECQPEMADEILTLSCDELEFGSSDPKADGFSQFVRGAACSSGLLRYCDMPGCQAPRYPDYSENCADYIGLSGCGACEYYACREAQATNQCGDTGYYIAHGYKYCNRLIQVASPRMSPAGQRWLEDGRDCLMHFIETEISSDEQCRSLRDRAYASHPDCYVDHGFCDLPFRDWLALFATIDTLDLDFVEVLTTSMKCVEQYADRFWALF